LRKGEQKRKKKKEKNKMRTINTLLNHVNKIQKTSVYNAQKAMELISRSTDSDRKRFEEEYSVSFSEIEQIVQEEAVRVDRLFKGFEFTRTVEPCAQFHTVRSQKELRDLQEGGDIEICAFCDLDVSGVEADRLKIRSDFALTGSVRATHLTICRSEADISRLRMECTSLRLEKPVQTEIQIVIGTATLPRVAQVIHVPDSVTHLSLFGCSELEYLVFGGESQCTRLELSDDRDETWNVELVGSPPLKCVYIGVAVKKPLQLGYASYVVLDWHKLDLPSGILKKHLKGLFCGWNVERVVIAKPENQGLLADEEIEDMVFFSSCRPFISLVSVFDRR